jgi:DNA helicase-2/ATP-dependent DNA helicase PcrA
MDLKKFSEFYKKLNPQQKIAVDSVEGPVMVVAGPGTGKTQILALRIANILKETQTEPENILALTFTEAGAVSMRQRLAEIIGTPAYAVVINTFHGFCNDIIRNYPEEFPRIIGSQNINEVDQINIIEEAISELSLKNLKPFGDPSYYVGDILKAIDNLKKEGVTPKEFETINEKEIKKFETDEGAYHIKGAHKGKMKGEYQKLLKQIQKNIELAEIYEYYENRLTQSKLYDYNDMVMESLRTLSANKELLLILQEQHQYILVDEHQDTNRAQNKIMELLCNFHNNPNIFVVGDEKQAIFRFQGASLENFNYFKKLYPEAKLIILEQNYRSTQAILDSAESVISGKEKLKSNFNLRGEKISIGAFSNSGAECYFIAKDIEKKIKAGISPSEIAVLYRDNKDALPFVSMFEKIGIPFSVESDQDVMSDGDIQKIIKLLRAIDDFGSEEKLLEAAHADFLEINPLDLYKIIFYSGKNKISAFEIIKSEKELKNIKLDDGAKVSEFYKKIYRWAVDSKNKTLSEFFEELVRESGYLAYILKKSDSANKMDKLNGLFDEIKGIAERHKNSGLRDFLDYLDVLEDHNLLIKKGNILDLANQVRLMTAHRSKGQEFEYVYIVNAYDGHWGNKRRPILLKLPASVYSLSGEISEKEAANNDERRLFYVALTRAKKGVAITYSKVSVAKTEQLPSQFIQEIKPELVNLISAKKYEKEFKSNKEIIFAPSLISGVSVKNKEFVKEIFFQNGLSPTALNNYLRCPWNYFYMNLLRLPMAKTKSQIYGTAVHEALKDFFSAANKKSGKTPGKNFLIKSFGAHLEKETLKPEDARELLKKGKRALTGYFNAFHKSWPKEVITEFKIEAALSPGLKITGKIDKMEILKTDPLKNLAEVNVVDYKTSKPKTRGEIEGLTKNSNGDIKRQLVFYNLLLNKYKDGKRYKMVSGEIDFIEPDEKGSCKRKIFSVDKEEVAELESLIKKTAEEIINLDFWNKGCGKKDCEFCALRKMMD